MQTVVRFALVAAVLSVLCLSVPSAQKAKPENPDKIGKSEDGEGIVLRGVVEDVPLSEIIQLYSEYKGRTVIYDPRKLSGDVSFTAPRDGFSPDMEDALRATLAEFRLTIVSTGDFDTIVPLAEACTVADVVTVDELASLPPLRPVRVVINLINADANAVRGALQNLTTRQGGMVNPVSGRGSAQSIIICDYAFNVLEIVKIVEQLDAPSGNESHVVKLKNRKAEELLTVVSIAAGKLVSVGIDAGTDSIVLSGPGDEVDRVSKVIAALDVQQPK
ncbi:MAG: hypothetical protein KDB68_00035 [Planctomycetes bacterium]|nr:hypothetical protein [Planctomycetota bacterium]